MDRVLKPNCSDTEPDDETASKQLIHWLKTFEIFLGSLNTTTTPVSDATKPSILINYIAPTNCELFSECQTFTDAMKIPKDIYRKPKSEDFSRHLLKTRKRRADGSLEHYLNSLKILAKNCM